MLVNRIYGYVLICVFHSQAAVYGMNLSCLVTNISSTLPKKFNT